MKTENRHDASPATTGGTDGCRYDKPMVPPVTTKPAPRRLRVFSEW